MGLKVPDYEMLFGKSVDAVELKRISITWDLNEIFAMGPRCDVFGDVIIH